ncbi:MAG TPA: hypothetical protein VFS11_05855 [Gemmatimonadales bacterium]|nr:hypothetical protein [Gemmatimonadales bacterium]
MATVPRSGASYDVSTAAFALHVSGLLAGEALVAGDAVYIKSDGKLWKSNGTAVNAAAACIGFAAGDTDAGEACTVFGIGSRWRYDKAGGLTPGANYYIAATAGRLDTAATTGGLVPVAKAVSTTDLILIAAS